MFVKIQFALVHSLIVYERSVIHIVMFFWVNSHRFISKKVPRDKSADATSNMDVLRHTSAR